MKTFSPYVVVLAAAVAALQPIAAFAWGPQGHRLVARVAETELTPQARAQVAQLLAGESNPSLAGVATWADELREHDPDLGKRSGPWHYVNLGEHECGYVPARDCPDGNCVIAALDQQTALLADRSQPLDVRRQALKFVVHFVGDIHQPMHAGYAHDKGGNTFQLQVDGKGSNLHALWDSGMLNNSHLGDDAYLPRLLALPAAAAMSPALPPPAAAWAQASCKIAITPGVYPSEHVVPDNYIATYRPIAETQLRLAGDRLASVLNAALAAPEMETPMQPEVLAFFHADSNTFTYVVADAATGAAAVIDPALDYAADTGEVSTHAAQAIVDAIAEHGWQVHWLLETHAHADHLSAAQWLKQHWPQARIGIGEGIRDVQQTLAPHYALPEGFRADGSQFDHLFADDERFRLGGIQARVIAVPGHTSDSIAYLIGDALFPGDSLFMPDAGTARCDFPGGDARQLFASIQRLYALPEDTRVFVCHDYGPGGRAVAHQTSIGEQRRRNIHVRDGVEIEAFVAQRQARDATLPEPKLIRPALQANLQAGRCSGVVR